LRHPLEGVTRRARGQEVTKRGKKKKVASVDREKQVTKTKLRRSAGGEWQPAGEPRAGEHLYTKKNGRILHYREEGGDSYQRDQFRSKGE